MRNIRVYFDSDAGSIAYHIDLETKRIRVGNVKENEFTEIFQDEFYKLPTLIQRQLTNLLAIELNRQI